MRELKIPQTTTFIEEHGRNCCKRHIDIVSSDKIPKCISKYQPKEKQYVGKTSETKDSVI
jgi:hypothetical protein